MKLFSVNYTYIFYLDTFRIENGYIEKKNNNNNKIRFNVNSD